MTTETNSALNGVKEAFAPVTDALKNIQNLEVPEAARDFVKRAAGTAKDRARWCRSQPPCCPSTPAGW
jgi:hypothetical protein